MAGEDKCPICGKPICKKCGIYTCVGWHDTVHGK